jgi:hypothetical protein
MNIIGLGKAGCNIARAFSKFPQYNCVGIDVDPTSDIVIKKKSSHEEYDAKFPNLTRRFPIEEGEGILLIVCGAGTISGGVLRLLEQLKSRKEDISVLYIKPDGDLLSELHRTQERVVRNILQEYARSGQLDMIYLVENSEIAKGIGEVPIIGYFDVLNQGLVNLLHMINVFRNSEPVMGNFGAPTEIARICTIGVVDLENNKENWFLDLQNARDVVYYYGINEEELRTDGTLFKKITDFVKSKSDDSINVSYGVYKTTYDQQYCYCIKYSSVIQLQLDGQDIG